jgi:serine protease Do
VNNASGAVITQVEPNSPGAKAGLKVGDVITELNGKAVSDAGELQVEVGQKQPGTTPYLKALRDGNSVDVPVTLEAMGKGEHDNESADASHGKPRWGLGLADLTPDVRQQLQADEDVHGAVIERKQDANSQPAASWRTLRLRHSVRSGVLPTERVATSRLPEEFRPRARPPRRAPNLLSTG